MNNIKTATFASGCFWCTEAIFSELKGVSNVRSGYMGGTTPNPTYDAICTGTTGYAEVIHFNYDESIISFEKLLEVFWKTHDPTTLNQQGADVGTQYRSAIFFHNEQQKTIAEKYKAKLNDAKIWENPIVTEITAAEKFYPAEDYHQNYYSQNANKNPYCTMVITPKLEKFRKIFSSQLK